MTKNNDLVIGILGELFGMGIIVPQRAKEAPKTSEGLPVLLSVAIQEKHDNMKDKGSSTVENKNMVIHKSHILGQQWGAGRSLSKIIEEGKTMDIDREEHYSRRKDKLVLLTSGSEDKNPEKMESLYASVKLWGTEEEEVIYSPYWKGVDEYQYPVDPISLSANFTTVFPEVISLRNSHLE